MVALGGQSAVRASKILLAPPGDLIFFDEPLYTTRWRRPSDREKQIDTAAQYFQ